MGRSFFPPVEKKVENVENWDIARRSGTADGVKWDSSTYLFTSIDTRNKGDYKQMYMGTKSVRTCLHN